MYRLLSPEHPGIRADEILNRPYQEIAIILMDRLGRIKAHVAHIGRDNWIADFVQRCEKEEAGQREYVGT